MDLPLTPVEKILKKSNMRISDGAVKEFATLLEEITSDIAAEAASIAKSESKTF
jgi:histone H3/H4